MFIFLIVILVLGALLELLSLRGGTACVGLDLTLTEMQAEPGQKFGAATTVTNTGRLPISYLCVTTAYPLQAKLPENCPASSGRYAQMASDVYRLWWRQKLTRTLPLSIEKRGIHSITCEELKRGDFLGLRTSSSYVMLRRSILIYPKRLENAALTEALGSYCGDLIAQRWLIRDPILTLGVREYTGNEPMHTISWSQTARRGELTVREFDYTRSLSCCVIFCTNGLLFEEEDLLDTCCSAVRTVCETLVEHGVEAVLYTNAGLSDYTGEPVRKCTATQGRTVDMLDMLARVAPLRTCTAQALVSECLRAQSDAAAYVLIAPHRIAETEDVVRLLNERTGLNTLMIAAEELEMDGNG